MWSNWEDCIMMQCICVCDIKDAKDVVFKLLPFSSMCVKYCKIVSTHINTVLTGGWGLTGQCPNAVEDQVGLLSFLRLLDRD